LHYLPVERGTFKKNTKKTYMASYEKNIQLKRHPTDSSGLSVPYREIRRGGVIFRDRILKPPDWFDSRYHPTPHYKSIDRGNNKTAYK